MVVTIGNRETGNFWTEGSQGVHLRLSSLLRYQLGFVKLFLSRFIFNVLYFYSLTPDSRENVTADHDNDCFLNETWFLCSGETNGNIHSDSNKAKSWEFAFGKVHFRYLEEFSKDVTIKMRINSRYEE